MSGRRPTLLIVDDEPDVAESLRHLFRRDYRVLTAASGPDALELLHEHEVHVILSDQRMPGMTGDVFLAQARSVRPDAVRMLFTGYADIQAVISAVNEGRIFRYILKPWDPLELESLVRQAADQYALIGERNRLLAELSEANTRLLAANHDLAEANQLKSAFMEVASHEFNTPITLVLGLSELLRLLDPNRAAEEREVIDRIVASSRQLAKLVSHTLTVMQRDDFRTRLRVESVDFGALLADVAARVRPFVTNRQQDLAVRIDDDLGQFQIDATKLEDAILNLLTNAIKFTPDGGSLALSAHLSGPNAAEIVVEDQGIGLEPRAVKHLFEPFFTEFDPSRHSSGEFGFEKRGLGLGLSIARQFIELHGGTIQATSTPGVGTRITIRLPRQPVVLESSTVQ